MGKNFETWGMGAECSIWMEWVHITCTRRGIPVPTGPEWDALLRDWRQGKAYLESVNELIAMRV